MARNCLERLTRGIGTKVRYIQGQHDLVVQAHYENHPWLSMVSGTEHMHQFAFDFLGKPAYGLDFFPQALEDLNFAKVPGKTQVLFLHGTVDTVMPMGFHFSAANIPSHIETVFAGDWHEAAEIKLDKDGGRMLYYPGSTFLRAANEPVEKYVYKVTVESDALSVEPVQLRTRQVVKLSQLELDDLHRPTNLKADDTLPEELQTPVILVDQEVDAASRMVLSGFGHLYTTVDANPTVEAQPVNEIESLSNAEILERYVDKEKYPDEFEFTLDVIENPVADALERLKKKLGIEVVDLTTQQQAEDTTVVL